MIDPRRSMRFLLIAALAGCVSGDPAAAPEPASAAAAEDTGTAAAADHAALRAELLAMAAADQEARGRVMAAFQAGADPSSPEMAGAFARVQEVDSAHVARLREIVRQHGWPTDAMVGAEARAAVWLLVQHADRHPDLQGEYLEWMERSYHAGDLPREAGQELALLTDRVRTNQGRPQLYGTQAEIVGGRLVLHPIENEAEVDLRRAALGMPPLAEYLVRLREAYGLPPNED